MSFFANIFKPAAQPAAQSAAHEELQQAEQVMNKLRLHRGSETAKWLRLQDQEAAINSLMAGGALPPVKDPPKLEDVDKREVDNSQIYTPPIEAMYTRTEAVAAAPIREQPLSENAQVNWIERIFDEFVRCADEFNKTNTDQSLFVNVYRPEYKYESSTYDTYVPNAKISVFKGHISTNKWGMLVQGHGTTIEIFVVPAENLLRLTLNDLRDTGFPPLMVITAVLVNGQPEWHIEEEVVSFHKLPLLGKELFGDLIRIASGKMNDSELFADYSKGLKLGETVAQGYSQAAPTTDSSSTAPLDQKLGTWKECQELMKIIGNDLTVIADREHTANDSGNKDELQRLKELSTDLRALTVSISELLNKYAPDRDAATRASS
jgi:hypothetical protein